MGIQSYDPDDRAKSAQRAKGELAAAKKARAQRDKDVVDGQAERAKLQAKAKADADRIIAEQEKKRQKYMKKYGLPQ